jgi:hypothetical protein
MVEMAIKRRRILYATVAAAFVTFCWKYGPPAGDTTRLSPVSGYHSEGGSDAPERVIAKMQGIAGENDKPDPARTRQRYALSNFLALPSGPPAFIPRIQFSFPPQDAAESQMQVAVKEAFIHSWNGYKKYAWLKDEVAPLTGGHRNTLSGWAATLVDSLDTLWIMGLEKEFHEAINAAATINFQTPASLPINVFETTIRFLGGFLGAYDVSGGNYPILLEKAREIGEVGFQ